MSELLLPSGFRFAGIHCGIKPQKKDLALVIATSPCRAWGVYTQNLVRAACIDWNRSIPPGAYVRGVAINSGNANACTGELGRRNNEQFAKWVSEGLTRQGLVTESRELFVLSTGVIGQHLPMGTLETGIPLMLSSLGDSAESFRSAATAILTTDHGPKWATRSFSFEGRNYRIAGMAKGAGMIGPNMATMLGILVTDCPVPAERGQMLLQRVVDATFNRISVEGHTSTNDAVILLAADENKTEASSGLEAELEVALRELAGELSQKIPTDGEGASHLIHIQVRGAADNQGADKIARTIALSNLVKTAVAGADPNWGRIVSAAGYAGIPFSVAATDLTLNQVPVFLQGAPCDFDRRQVSRSLKENFRTEIVLTVGDGPGAAEHWTSDLTADYVKLNAEYTT